MSDVSAVGGSGCPAQKEKISAFCKLPCPHRAGRLFVCPKTPAVCKLKLQISCVLRFVLTILKSSRLYREPEMIRIQNVLEHLKNQKDIERQKFKGDNLLESGEVEEAILVYQAILNGEKDETVDEKFYGKIYASLGAAYGRLFLYQESAKMYDCAYQICGDKTLIKPYLYASYKYMSLEEYHILITKSEEYMEINAQMRREVDKINQEVSVEPEPGIMEKWKRSHRRSHA